MNPEYLRVAVELARRAGIIARENFALGMAREWKADDTPVTVTDLAINRMVIDEIAARFPEHGVLGEEASDYSDGQEWIWVCDPIDGTVPFAHGIPTSAFSLALTHHGESVLGVVYDFLGDRLLTAVQGEGAFMNGSPIRVSPQTILKAGVVDIEGIWSRSVTTDVDLSALPFLLEEERARIIKLSSIVYAGMLVSLGELMAVISRADKPWDVAALAIIVPEAGGRVTDLRGAPLRCDRPINGALITNGALHESALNLVSRSHSAGGR